VQHEEENFGSRTLFLRSGNFFDIALSDRRVVLVAFDQRPFDDSGFEDWRRVLKARLWKAQKKDL